MSVNWKNWLMKNSGFAFFVILICILGLAGCSTVKNYDLSKTYGLKEDCEFGGAFITVSINDFNEAGFEYGDGCNVVFSNGYCLYDIPYYSGYYERVNKPVIVSYPGYEYVAIAFCSGDSVWKIAELSEDMTATVSLNARGKYLVQENTMNTVYSNNRADFAEDTVFSNFRAMKGGKLKKDTFFRGTSPINDTNKRALCTDNLIEKNGIRYILDLADNEEKINSYTAESPYFRSLVEQNRVALLGISAAYRSDDFKRKLADGLREMSMNQGPYYIHCTEGKDRTGFVCLLLEALVGASFEELEDDYMETYKNYFNISRNSDSDKYEALKELRLYDMLWYLADLPDNTDLSGMHFEEAAKKYLLSAGMTDKEISNLVDFLT